MLARGGGSCFLVGRGLKNLSRSIRPALADVATRGWKEHRLIAVGYQRSDGDWISTSSSVSSAEPALESASPEPALESAPEESQPQFPLPPPPVLPGSERLPARVEIANLCKDGKWVEAIDELEKRGVQADATYAALIRWVTNTRNLEQGRRIHNQIKKCGLDRDRFLGNNLIGFYTKCGLLADAEAVFKRVMLRNAVTYSSMIAAFNQFGRPKQMIETYVAMRAEGLRPDKSTFITLFNACLGPEDLEVGKEMHSVANERNFDQDVMVMTSVVGMYGRCGSATDARKVFDKLQRKDIVAWNNMLLAYARNKQGVEAIQLFRALPYKPNKFTLLAIFEACSNPECIAEGKQIHEWIMRFGMDTEAGVAASLVSMYCKVGYVEDAVKAFMKVPRRDGICLAAMVTGYAENNRIDDATMLLSQADISSLRPNGYSLKALLDAASCSPLKSLSECKRIHGWITNNGTVDESLTTSIIDAYLKCESLEDAQAVFDNNSTKNVGLWNILLGSLVKQGYCKEAIQNFRAMIAKEDGADKVVPDKVTFETILEACGILQDAIEGMATQERIAQSGLEVEMFGSSLIKMYAKCGNLDLAKSTFDKLKRRNVPSWNAIIEVHVERKLAKEALNYYKQMLEIDKRPDAGTFVGVLNACVLEGLEDEGRKHFASMNEKHSVPPKQEHYKCMADLLNRVGKTEEAQEYMKKAGLT